MKTKLFTLLTGILLLTIANAQTKLHEVGFAFQGYAVNTEGKALSNEDVLVSFTIYSTTTNTTTTSYTQVDNLTTDVFGVFTAIVGSKNPTGFKAIDYSVLQNLKVEIKKKLSITPYITIHNGQMLSVPYAQYANIANLADSAHNAHTSITAILADSAHKAHTSITAILADSAHKAHIAITAITAIRAILADSAHKAHTAITSIRAILADSAHKAHTAITANNAVPIGTIISFAGNAGTTVPDGWLICDGKEYSIAAYTDLYNVVLDYWRTSTSTSTFYVPDLRNKFLLGKSDARIIGDYEDQGAGDKNYIAVTPTDLPGLVPLANNSLTNDLRPANFAVYYLIKYK
jgi:hypothetical protein